MTTRQRFRGGKTRVSSEERRERTKYKQYMDLLKNRFSIKDTLYEEKHYGFLNKDYQVVQHLSGIDAMRFGTYAPTVYGLNFVVDQYTEFRDFYLNFTAETGQTPPSLVEDLLPGKSFSSFDTNYQQHLSALMERIFGEIVKHASDQHRATLPLSHPILFYDHFNKNILFSAPMVGQHISKSGYAISARSKVYQTGLYVDLSPDTPPRFDEAKGEMLADPGFLCYLTFATNHGFSVDFNAPWRLILDLEHPKTKTNILNGRPLDQYWNFYYDQYVENTGFSYDYNNIRDFYESLYKTYYRVYNKLTISEANSLRWSEIYKTLFRQSASASRLGPGKFWVETFILNRLREVGMVRTYRDFLENTSTRDIVEHAMLIYGEEATDLYGFPVENKIITGKVGQPDSGVAAYVTTKCGEFLKDKIVKVE